MKRLLALLVLAPSLSACANTLYVNDYYPAYPHAIVIHRPYAGSHVHGHVPNLYYRSLWRNPHYHGHPSRQRVVIHPPVVKVSPPAGVAVPATSLHGHN